MAIIHTRIDDRLIHGQVATMWTNQLGATRIMVVDDKASGDDVMKMSLKMATPSGVALSVLTVEKASARIADNAYEGQRVFLIVRSPQTLLRLVEAGVDIRKVNVGNLTFTEGKTKISNTVAITEQEVVDFTKLHDTGMEITLQLTPNMASEDFMGVVHKTFK